MGKRLTITLPTVPAYFLAENQRRRMGWGEYARRLLEEKNRLYGLLLEALSKEGSGWDGERPSFERYSVAFTFRFRDRRKRDRDGLSGRVKVVLDALCSAQRPKDTFKAGIVPDDSDDYLVDYVMRRPEYGCESDELLIEIWEENENRGGN
ncbi:MAG: hypothetical protein ABIH46_11565 [Chloroflexota bacterium]